MDKPPSMFKELLEQAGVVFSEEPFPILKIPPQHEPPISSLEELTEKLINT